MLSFIVPAHNEEFWLSKTLNAIHDSARFVNQDYEIIVVDDDSTDNTAQVARSGNAVVLQVQHRQIAATRNAGARIARGERLFFVDADTTINPRAVESALRWMDRGAAGGGAPARFEGSVPLYARLLLAWLGFFMKMASLSGGAFMFCTREAFQAVGGFDERLFGAEDAAMSASLKRCGRFVVLNERIRTSGRRVRAMPGLQTLAFLVRIAFVPAHLTRRTSVENVWYVSDREQDRHSSSSLSDRVSNGIALLILAVLVTIPIWMVPWPQMLLNGPLGYVRLFGRVILAHTGLVLWPCSLFLWRTLSQEKGTAERVKLAVLFGISLLIACLSTLGVFRFWGSLFHQLVD